MTKPSSPCESSPVERIRTIGPSLAARLLAAAIAAAALEPTPVHAFQLGSDIGATVNEASAAGGEVGEGGGTGGDRAKRARSDALDVVERGAVAADPIRSGKKVWDKLARSTKWGRAAKRFGRKYGRRMVRGLARASVGGRVLDAWNLGTEIGDKVATHVTVPLIDSYFEEKGRQFQEELLEDVAEIKENEQLRRKVEEMDQAQARLREQNEAEERALAEWAKEDGSLEEPDPESRAAVADGAEDPRVSRRIQDSSGRGSAAESESSSDVDDGLETDAEPRKSDGQSPDDPMDVGMLGGDGWGNASLESGDFDWSQSDPPEEDSGDSVRAKNAEPGAEANPWDDEYETNAETGDAWSEDDWEESDPWAAQAHGSESRGEWGDADEDDETDWSAWSEDEQLLDEEDAKDPWREDAWGVPDRVAAIGSAEEEQWDDGHPRGSDDGASQGRTVGGERALSDPEADRSLGSADPNYVVALAAALGEDPALGTQGSDYDDALAALDRPPDTRRDDPTNARLPVIRGSSGQAGSGGSARSSGSGSGFGSRTLSSNCEEDIPRICDEILADLERRLAPLKAELASGALDMTGTALKTAEIWRLILDSSGPCWEAETRPHCRERNESDRLELERAYEQALEVARAASGR